MSNAQGSCIICIRWIVARSGHDWACIMIELNAAHGGRWMVGARGGDHEGRRVRQNVVVSLDARTGYGLTPL